MKRISMRILAPVLMIGAGVLAWHAEAGRELVSFPHDFEKGVHYATINRGNTKEKMFTSRPAINAMKDGPPIPGGTVITLVGYRDGKLFRYVVMEKRTGWGTEYPLEMRNGEWEFQAFNADQSVNLNENVSRRGVPRP